MMEKPLLAFGEVLWDIFPDGKRLGGAPLNFSYYFQKAGGNPRVISAVGYDNLGIEAIYKIAKMGLDSSHIRQINKQTGIVDILLDIKGHQFNIRRKAAWENIFYPNRE